jgi:hypothetical protein
MMPDYREYFAREERLRAARAYVMGRIGRRSKFKPRLRAKYKNK